MTERAFLKAAVSTALCAAMVMCAAADANAQIKDEIPVQAVPANDYTDTYKAYLNGEVDVSEDSGVGIARYSVPGKILEPSGSLPSSYVTETTGIRNQGSSNTCWAFSGVGTLEAFLSKQGKGDFDLSEQHLSWWATSYYNNDGTGWLNKSLAPGGYSKTSAGYFASWQGPKLESDLPYGGSSYPEGMRDYENAFNVTGIQYVNGDITSVKTAVMNYGAVATSFNNGSGYSNGKSCYYSPADVTRFSGHAITVIGWDDDYSMYNFDENKRPPADGAWLAKNSWGTGVGDEGYLWISYYDRYVFNTNVWGENLAITSARTATGYDKMYQNEHYGSTYYTYFAKSKGDNYLKATFVNVFDFDDEHKYLDKIIFQTLNEKSTYTAYYIPVEDGAPVTDRTEWSFIDTGVINTSGYISIEAKGFEIPAGLGAVGIEIDGTDVNDYASIGVDEWLKAKNGDYLFMPETHRGDSFIIANDKAYDLLDVYAANNDNIGGTIVIKAVATTNIIGDVDHDGEPTVLDALLTLRASVMLESLEGEQQINGDVNFDGVIDSEDSLLILRRTVKLVSDF